MGAVIAGGQAGGRVSREAIDGAVITGGQARATLRVVKPRGRRRGEATVKRGTRHPLHSF